MSRWYIVRNTENGESVLERAKLCKSFWSHLKGLQFSSRLKHGHGLWFVTGREGISHTAIHMFFVFFEIGVIWVDANGLVVDKCLAKPWRPYYASRFPARDFIEATPDILDRVNLGDRLLFEEIPV